MCDPSITINNSYHHQYPFQLTVNMFKFQTNKTLLISPSFHSLTSQNSSPYFLILCFYPSLFDPEQSGFCFWLYTEIDKIFFSLCTPWYWRLCFLKVVPFSCLQSFPASGSFPVNQLVASGSQSTGASASASVLPMNVQGWFPLGLTGLISLQSTGLSRVFFSTTIWKNQCFGDQPSLSSNFHICTWLLKKS